jgi:hypothetical protein
MFQEARHDCNQDKPDSCELDQIHHGAIECRQRSRNRQERSLSAHQIVVLDAGGAAFASLRSAISLPDQTSDRQGSQRF